MELYKELLENLAYNNKIEISFPQFESEEKNIITNMCYKILCEIRNAVNDDSLTDEDCFMKIERIISVFEKYGIKSGPRHDF